MKKSLQDNRRARLKKFFEGKSLPTKEKSYLSQLMSGTASFGERAARRLERDYSMGDGYLDMPDMTDVSDALGHPLSLTADEATLIANLRALVPQQQQEIMETTATAAALARVYVKIGEDRRRKQNPRDVPLGIKPSDWLPDPDVSMNQVTEGKK